MEKKNRTYLLTYSAKMHSFQFQTNAVLLNFIHQESWNKRSWFPQKYEAAHLFSTLIIIRNVSW